MFVTTMIFKITCSAICAKIPVTISEPYRSGAFLAININLYRRSPNRINTTIAPKTPSSSQITLRIISFCAAELGVDLPQLPLVLSAAQWLEEQALADGCFGLALGLPLHLGLPPFVTGSKTAVKVLTEDMKELTGGQVIINGDAKESADILEQIILEKRQGLHI